MARIPVLLAGVAAAVVIAVAIVSTPARALAQELSERRRSLVPGPVEQRGPQGFLELLGLRLDKGAAETYMAAKTVGDMRWEARRQPPFSSFPEALKLLYLSSSSLLLDSRNFIPRQLHVGLKVRDLLSGALQTALGIDNGLLQLSPIVALAVRVVRIKTRVRLSSSLKNERGPRKPPCYYPFPLTMLPSLSLNASKASARRDFSAFTAEAAASSLA